MPGLPLPLDDEKEQLLLFLQQQRDGIRYAVFGLDDASGRKTSPVGALNLGGLVKHLAAVERAWANTIRQAPRSTDPAAYANQFTLVGDETLEGVLADYAAACDETDQLVRTLELDAPVPVPKGVPWFPDDVDAWTVRWVVLHLIQETARHAGHADIVRESIDGATMYELMAGVEGWPETEWIKPWKPKG